jgi:hypothetical protein
MEKLDDDGYPTQEFLDAVSKWDYTKGFNAWFEFIHYGWWMEEWGFHSETVVNEDGEQVIRYDLSTGGWSGNEDLIEAMMQNFICWSYTWQSNRRGGHYVFEVKEPN